MGRDHFIGCLSDVLAFGNDVPGGVSHVLRSIGILGSDSGAFLIGPIDGGLRDGRLGLPLGLRYEPEVARIGHSGSLDGIGTCAKAVLEALGPLSGIGEDRCLVARTQARCVKRL